MSDMPEQIYADPKTGQWFAHQSGCNYIRADLHAAVKAENERLRQEYELLRIAQGGEYADTWKARAEAAERALVERAVVKATRTDILREWFGGQRYARDYEYLDANYGEQANRVVAFLSALTTEPVTPEGPQEVGVARKFGGMTRAVFDKNRVPAGTKLYTRPAEQAVTGKFALGDRVTKSKGSSWTGRVVGFYSTALTPIGYAVESDTETGSVQIYPQAALTTALAQKEEGR